jgi:hypothetical protein
MHAMKASRRALTFLSSLLAVGMIASAGLAVTKQTEPSPRETATSESDAGTICVDEGITVVDPDASGDDIEGCEQVDGASEDGEPSSPEEGDSEGPDAPDEEDTDTDGPGGDEPDAVDPIREATCNDAAGVTPDSVDDTDATDLVAEEPHGLENAIARVLENCMLKPQAPGLLVAIRHLVLNKAKHDAHVEAKTDAKNRAKKQPSPGRSAAANHRAAGATGGSRGNGGPPGHGSSHGNGNAYGRGGGNGHAYGSANGNGNGSANGNGSGFGGSTHGSPHGG